MNKRHFKIKYLTNSKNKVTDIVSLMNRIKEVITSKNRKFVGKKVNMKLSTVTSPSNRFRSFGQSRGQSKQSAHTIKLCHKMAEEESNNISSKIFEKKKKIKISNSSKIKTYQDFCIDLRKKIENEEKLIRNYEKSFYEILVGCIQRTK